MSAKRPGTSAPAAEVSVPADRPTPMPVTSRAAPQPRPRTSLAPSTQHPRGQQRERMPRAREGARREVIQLLTLSCDLSFWGDSVVCGGLGHGSGRSRIAAVASHSRGHLV